MAADSNSILRLELAEKVASGMSMADAALACNVSHSVASREMGSLYSGRRIAERPEFATGLALHLLEQGHLLTKPSDGKDWDELLMAIRRYLRRYNLAPPGSVVNYPGSSRFSTIEQAAMVSKYLRAREENHGTVYMGTLFMEWGITASMMDSWRKKFLKGSNPHYRDSRAHKQREGIFRTIAEHGPGTVTKTYIDQRHEDLSRIQLSNRLRELCRVKRLVAVYSDRGFHLGYRLADASLYASKSEQTVSGP